jgi:hypothetical protein
MNTAFMRRWLKQKQAHSRRIGIPCQKPHGLSTPLESQSAIERFPDLIESEHNVLDIDGARRAP